MNVHVSARKMPKPSQRLHKIGKAALFLKKGRKELKLPSLLFQMLQVLYKFEGFPVIGMHENCKALIFNANANPEETSEYPILFLDGQGLYRVHSIMKQPDKPLRICSVETMTDTTWEEQKFY